MASTTSTTSKNIETSVIFAAYKTPGLIEENISELRRYPCEIIIAADTPDIRLKYLIKKYKLKASISEKKRGKWKALNDAVKIAKGEYIVFLDSDTKLLTPIDDIVKALKNCHAVEIRKEISGNTRMEKLVNIDYLNMFAISKLAIKLNLCLGLNGAAFAIRKNVFLKMNGFRNTINEDTDLGVRLGIKGYKISVEGKAKTQAPNNFREWFIQRERWAMGGAEVFYEYIAPILRKPAIWIPALYLLFPAIVAFALNNLIGGDILVKIMYFILPVVMVLPQKILVFVFFFLFQENMLKNALIGAITFFIWLIVEISIALKLKWRISYLMLPVFYFVYSPLWLIIAFIAFIRVGILKVLRKPVKVKNW